MQYAEVRLLIEEGLSSSVSNFDSVDSLRGGFLAAVPPDHAPRANEMGGGAGLAGGEGSKQSIPRLLDALASVHWVGKTSGSSAGGYARIHRYGVIRSMYRVHVFG